MDYPEHAFSREVLEHFIDPHSLLPLSPPGSRFPHLGFVRQVRRKWIISSRKTITLKVYVINSPHVLEAVRTHFNCGTLEGAQLENDGGPGTSNVHWEKRLFGPEIMTGELSRNAIFSQITGALLKDSGWYMIDERMLEPLTWGASKGCLFATASCREYMDFQP
ncbi:unnamed protein product [Soboliphyme baturini]|uniref:Leishmanolysin-like peptidase n=1 Tax=Soboliphyme baturini TaxID=241478 RepID=A0A183IBQ9_9BILA|nr:unnamed protein product [Soboliphyme baturini]